MPSSKGYRPTAFHVTYARQEQRSSKSPLLIRPAGLTTLFRLHFFPVPLSKNCRALSQESTTSLLSIVREEMEKHDVHRLLLVRVRYGALSNIVPEALSFAFEALTAGTDFEGAVLETEEVPITLKCSQCGHTFPAVKGEHFFAPCPACGEQYGHSMETGRELYVQHIEAE